MFPVQWLLCLAGTELAAGGAERGLLWRSPSLYGPWSGETNGVEIKCPEAGGKKLTLN